MTSRRARLSRALAPVGHALPRWGIRFLPWWGVRWVHRGRARHRGAAAPISAEATRALAGFFPSETLAAARVAIVPQVPLSRILRLARRIGISAVDADRLLGITYLDTIVVPRQRSDPAHVDGVALSTLFHELVHIEQARQLGVRGFVERYLRGWLENGRKYAAIPLEKDAYALEARYRAAPGEPFDVAAEVSRRLDAGMTALDLREATLADRPALAGLIAGSARGLSRDDYTDAQVESALATGVFGVDSALIADGTYFVAEMEGRIVGCGGWSRRRTLFGGDRFAGREAEELDPRSEPARIRAFFVDPEWSRRGIGRTILERCESDARARGFRSAELMATLPGEKLYRALGYEVLERVDYAMEDGVTIELVRMRKEL
jgi:GNAT superfamily N-acetyltransferase